MSHALSHTTDLAGYNQGDIQIETLSDQALEEFGGTAYSCSVLACSHPDGCPPKTVLPGR
jgi:hypothetical protein